MLLTWNLFPVFYFNTGTIHYNPFKTGRKRKKGEEEERERGERGRRRKKREGEGERKLDHFSSSIVSPSVQFQPFTIPFSCSRFITLSSSLLPLPFKEKEEKEEERRKMKEGIFTFICGSRNEREKTDSGSFLFFFLPLLLPKLWPLISCLDEGQEF